MPNSIRILVVKPIALHAVGQVVEVPAFEDGTPTQLFWRRRLRDAKVDGCVVLVHGDPPEAAQPDPVVVAAPES